jgi:hypothetical protein
MWDFIALYYSWLWAKFMIESFILQTQRAAI